MMLLIMCSVMNMPWGPPKPRKAVLEGRLVRQMRPSISTLAMLYTLSA